MAYMTGTMNCGFCEHFQNSTDLYPDGRICLYGYEVISSFTVCENFKKFRTVVCPKTKVKVYPISCESGIRLFDWECRECSIFENIPEESDVEFFHCTDKPYRTTTKTICYLNRGTLNPDCVRCSIFEPGNRLGDIVRARRPRKRLRRT